MSKRTLRRAAARAARKSANPVTPPPVQAQKTMAATAMANNYNPDPAEPPIGRLELQFCFDQAAEELRKSFIELETLERNSKKLRNLHIQEARLQRQRAKDIAALKQLIQERKAQEEATVELAKPHGSVFENLQNTPPAPAHTQPICPNTGPEPAPQPNETEQN